MKIENNSQNNAIHVAKDSKMFLELRKIVNRFDPVHLVEHGAPDDEHDRLTTEILDLLLQGSMIEIRNLLIHCLIWYGYDPHDFKEEDRERLNRNVERTCKEIIDWYETSQKVN